MRAALAILISLTRWKLLSMIKSPKLLWAGFLALAILQGWPDRGRNLNQAMHAQNFAARSLTNFLAAALLSSLALARSYPRPTAREVRAICLLVLMPTLTAVLIVTPPRQISDALPSPPWGLQLIAALAAPLWLALLAAGRASKTIVPRAMSGATIVALAGASLLLPGPAMTLRGAREIPATILLIALILTTVWTWSNAASQLIHIRSLTSATIACVVTCFANGVLSVLIERPRWEHVAIKEVLPPLLLETFLFTLPIVILWYWLLRRMPLASFSMQAIAAWFVPSLAGFLLYGFRTWRVDVAITLGIAALFVGLRARPEDDELTALHIP